MYTLHIQAGTVTRDIDGFLVAPAQDVNAPEYLEYMEWVNQGNSPTVLDEPIAETGPRLLTKLEYMERFTDEELGTIFTVAKQSVAVEVWLEKFKLASEINLDDPRILGGLLALESVGILATGRAQEIIA